MYVQYIRTERRRIQGLMHTVVFTSCKRQRLGEIRQWSSRDNYSLYVVVLQELANLCEVGGRWRGLVDRPGLLVFDRNTVGDDVGKNVCQLTV